MFPYLVPDFEFNGYVYRNRGGTFVGQSFKETCQESDIAHIWEAYENNYIVFSLPYSLPSLSSLSRRRKTQLVYATC